MLIASRTEIYRLLGRLEVVSWRPIATALGCLAAALLIAYFPSFPGLDPGARAAFFILLLAAGLWVTEAVPAYAVGVLVIGLEIAILGRVGGPFAQDADDWKRFIEPWASPLLWLFFGGFVLARGIANSGLDRVISLRVLQRFGTAPRRVLLGAMLVTFTFSMFASNTATAAMMVAVLAPLVSARQGDPFGKGLLLGVAFAANIGGMATLIGTPPNAIAAGALSRVEPVSFGRWLIFGLPPAVVLLAITWAYLVRRFPAAEPVDLAALGRPSEQSRLPLWQRGVVVIGLVLTVGGWLSEPLHGISPPVIAFVPLVLFTVAGVLVSEDIRSLDWDVLLLLAGGLALGVGVADTGLAQWVVDQLPVRGASPGVLALVLALATAILSNFMSNTAAANVVVPIGLALAVGAEVEVVVPVALAASSAMCLPVSTPPNAIVFAGGALETRDFLLAGALIGGLGTALAVAWVGLVV